MESTERRKEQTTNIPRKEERNGWIERLKIRRFRFLVHRVEELKLTERSGARKEGEVSKLYDKDEGMSSDFEILMLDSSC